MSDEQVPTVDEDRVEARAGSIPEEEVAGTDDAEEQARTVLEDSEARQADRDAAPDTVLEHRTSEDTVDPPD